MTSGVTKTEDYYEIITQIQKVLFRYFSGHADFLFIRVFEKR
jgi:hypothetical protein